MRIIPVMDVLNGVVVHAVGGRRAEYRPLVSKLIDSTDPAVVAEALFGATGAKEIYVADLDAILGNESGGTVSLWSCTEGCSPSAFKLWVDSGIRTIDQLHEMQCFDFIRPIVGTETANDELLAQPLPPVAILSLDFLHGELMNGRGDWREIVERTQPSTVILLDLAAVGEHNGPITTELVRTVRREFPGMEIITGGGIRNREDVQALADAGADGVLVSTALHSGGLFYHSASPPNFTFTA